MNLDFYIFQLPLSKHIKKIHKKVFHLLLKIKIENNADNILKAIDSNLKEKTKQLKILKKKLNWDSFSKQLLDFIK